MQLQTKQMVKVVQMMGNVRDDIVTITNAPVSHHSSDMEKFVQITQNVVRIFVCRMFIDWSWQCLDDPKNQNIVYKKMELPVRVHNIVVNPVLMMYVLMDPYDLPV